MRPLGVRQEIVLLRLLDDGSRCWGLTCSVTRSLERRGLVEQRVDGATLDIDGRPFDVISWYLTEEGERVARVVALKHQLAGKRNVMQVGIDWGQIVEGFRKR
jgi:hypothetical protein